MQECKLLDGVLLAARVKTLRDLFFDERFKFDFYDPDSCRQAERKNRKLGTVPLSIAHEKWRKVWNSIMTAELRNLPGKVVKLAIIGAHASG